MATAALIGAGIGGIATAIRLAVNGWQVTVFEANARPGGKLTDFEQDGFRFDAGPSLFTLPHLVDDLFRLAGENPADHFRYMQLPEICRYRWNDGTRLIADADPEIFARNIEQAWGEPAGHVRAFLRQSAFQYRTTENLFLRRSLHQPGTWFSREALRGYLAIPKLDLFRTQHAANASRFQHPKTVQLFDRYATYNGSDPYQAPALLNLIPHLEYQEGAYFPVDGMIGITNALEKLAQRLGVVFRYETPVTRILVDRRIATGLLTESGEQRVFDRIVSNMDITPTYRRLLPDEKAPERILGQPRSGSGLVFYWGIGKSFPELGLHSIFFSDDYRKEFEDQFIRKTIADDPTIYLNITAKYRPDDAPPGCENWFVLVNAPANEGQDWPAIIAHTRQHILAKLSRLLQTDIAALIRTEAILDPIRIEQRTSSAQGALYGTSSNNPMAAFLRHPNFSSRIGHLYFTGGSVHPGGGIPLCLYSSEIVASLIGKPGNTPRR